MVKATKKTATKRASKKRAADNAESGGATMDGPTLPPHANLSKPAASITCAGCGLVYAGRLNCPNCGFEASDEAIAALNKARADAGLPPYKG